MDLLGNEWITQSGLLYWNEFEVLLDYEVLFPPKILMPPTFEEAFGPGTWKLKVKLTFESISNYYNVNTLYKSLFEIYCHITYY